MRSPALLGATALLLAMGGCGSPEGVDAEDPADSVIGESGTRRDDPRYTVTASRQWVLKSDGLTAGEREVTVRVVAPAGTTRVRASVDNGRSVSGLQNADRSWTVRVPVESLATGDHDIRVAAGSSRSAVATRVIHVSYPVYAVVSTDWDDTRFSDRELARMEGLRQRHPDLRYTHFYAPYHYTDPELTEARRDEIDRWIKQQRDTHGDELGVHIHCWCHFVTAAGVTCRTGPAFAPGDTTGYITVLAAYTEDEMRRILAHSVRVFGEHGLGRPSSFRAGGWTADLSTLRALVSTGFTVDSSAMPPHRIASWRGYNLYTWNERNWTGITETSQPYFPSTTRITSSNPAPTLRILEVPDNGILVDYITGEDMVRVYEQNAPTGRTLSRSTLYQVGFHPPNFDQRYFDRMDMALTHVDRHLHSADLGPAVYARISDLQRVWH